jgi:hypothetical protein
LDVKSPKWPTFLETFAFDFCHSALLLGSRFLSFSLGKLGEVSVIIAALKGHREKSRITTAITTVVLQ